MNRVLGAHYGACFGNMAVIGGTTPVSINMVLRRDDLSVVY